jgi:aquaporin related protein
MQILGGFAGAAVLKSLTPKDILAANGNFCFTSGHGVSNSQIFGWEFFITFLLLTTVYTTAVEHSGQTRFTNMAPLAIGLSLFAGAQIAGYYTGGCANPARYFGPLVGIGGCPEGSTKAVFYVFGELTSIIYIIII